MPLSKPTRTGLLLLLVAGPLLVFLFLYLFGENHFEISRYPIQLSDMAQNSTSVSPKGLILIPADSAIDPSLRREYANELRRLRTFLSTIEHKPDVLNWGERILLNSVGSRLQYADTVFETTTILEKSIKRLPPAPRAFLFDSTQNLRGVYNLTSPLSVDTLILEYKILSRQ